MAVMKLPELLDLRERAVAEFIEGRTDQAAFRADDDAVSIGIDRVLTPDDSQPLALRVERFLAAILVDSDHRRPTFTAAKQSRMDFWQRHRLERLKNDDPAAYAKEIAEAQSIDTAKADVRRMSCPILAAISSAPAALAYEDRLAVLARRPPARSHPPETAAFPDVIWTESDRLEWAEFIGGVLCQGCGEAIRGSETEQYDGEPWPTYRARMAPLEEAFKGRHPDHGTRWTVGGGPLHCSRCCPPPPLSPSQIEHLARIHERAPMPTQTSSPQVRRCSACRQTLDSVDHVCEVADLPPRLRRAVQAVIDREAAARH
jgi:hypothetical protein